MSHRVALVFLRSMLRLLDTANIPSSPIPINLMMVAIRSSETSLLTSTQHNIPEYSFSYLFHAIFLGLNIVYLVMAIWAGTC
jgi:hypothetical protein